MPSIMVSIIINTFNRPELLPRSVQAALDQQHAERWPCELIVIDDGSDIPADSVLREAGLLERVRFHRIDHGGAAAARNAGIAMARGRWILFLGDDIIAQPDLVAEHMRLLESRPQEKIISLGLCEWNETGRSKVFLQFAQAHRFEDLRAGEPADFRYFYTANIAVPRLAFDEAGLFDEGFPACGWEDTDFGYRLQQRGWQLIYHPAARAAHIHPPMSIRQLVRKQEEIGFGACLFYARHRTPETAAAAFYPGTRQMRSGPRWRREIGIFAAQALERIAPDSTLLGKVYGRLVVSARTKGVERGRAAFPEAGI